MDYTEILEKEKEQEEIDYLARMDRDGEESDLPRTFEGMFVYGSVAA